MTEKQKHGQSLCPGGKEAPLSRNDCKACKGGQPLIVHIGKVNQILLWWWVSKARLPLTYATCLHDVPSPSSISTLNLNTIQDSKDLQRSATRPVFCMSCSSSLEEIFAGHQVHDDAPSSLPTNKTKVEGRKMVWSCHPSTSSAASTSSFLCSPLVSLRTAVQTRAHNLVRIIAD